MKYLLEAYQSSYHMARESALASPDYPVAATSMGYIPTYKACLQHLYTKPALCVRSLPWCTRTILTTTLCKGQAEWSNASVTAEVVLGEICTAHCITKQTVVQAMGGGGERLRRSIKVNGHANSYV